MTMFNYTPDQDVKVHEEGAIRLICKAFQSHEHGLPEWIKNASDSYVREEVSGDRRVIIVIFDGGRKNIVPSISCLDFTGMTSDAIENRFRIWADPDASRRGSAATNVQGGHGNGGKCYMTQMFDQYAWLHTVKQGKGNRYGVGAGSIKFGYIPDRNSGRDFPVNNPSLYLEKILTDLRCSSLTLPPLVQEVIKTAKGFTFVSGYGPKGYGNRIPVKHLLESLQDHPQMIQTLEMCKIYVVEDGKVLNQGAPLLLPAITPFPGAEKPRIIPVPETLKDPVSGEQVSTVQEGGSKQGELVLRTSDVSMRYSRKGRHVIIYKARSGYIGNNSVLDLDVQSPYRDRIYGECCLETLEPFKQNDRGVLASSPLTRAVKGFVSRQVELYAKEFEARERIERNAEEKNAISKMNEALDRWKNRLLDEIMQGLWGAGKDSTLPPQPSLPTGKPVRLELTLSHRRAGVGVSFRPILKFFDANGRRIRPVEYSWISEDNNVAMIDEDLMIINTFAYGKTEIYAEALNGKLKSNKVPLEVVPIQEIKFSPSTVEVSVGNRQKIEAVCRLANGESTSDVYLEWTENDPNIARVSASGLVFGFSLGETEVVAGDDKCLSKDPVRIKVTVGQSGGKGGDRGRGFPTVLVSGIDPDPQTNELVSFSKDDPPVWQRPQDVDRNIWWINSSAPLARLYLDPSKGYGHESIVWRSYHLERYIDVIVQIALTHGPADKEALGVGEWILKWGEQVAEIQTAAATDLQSFITSGELPIEQL